MRCRSLLCAAALAAVSGCAPAPDAASPPSLAGTGLTGARPGTCAILSINDSYRMEPSPDGTGGLARVRTLRRRLEEQYPDLLLLHAGDLLFPSLISREYKGAQMIDALNHLDGSEAFDPRLVVTFGNHEFDDDSPSVLTARLGESAFRWVSSNIEFAKTPAGTSAVATQKIAEDVVLGCGGFSVGLFGLTTDEKSSPYVVRYEDPVEIARARSKALRERGAHVVIGLTHLSIDEDEGILRTLGEDGPDLIVGGHEHTRQKRSVGGRAVYKADADARTANLLKVTLDARGISTEHAWLDVGPSDPPEDPALKTLVDAWLAKHEKAYCETKMKRQTGCLEEKLTVAGADLEAEETAIRRFETNMGDYVADRALGAFAKEGAQVAFLNSGTLRINYDIERGVPIVRRHVEELFAYPAPLRLIEITGATLQKIVNRSISGWTGQGHFLQIAGFAFRHDPKAGKATDLTLLGPSPRRVAPDDRLRAVVNTFLLDPAKGQDGYTMIGPGDIVDKLGPNLSEGPDLKQIVIDAFKLAGDAGIAPVADGRICNPQRQGPCLAK